jgi:hypothetical protein
MNLDKEATATPRNPKYSHCNCHYHFYAKLLRIADRLTGLLIEFLVFLSEMPMRQRGFVNDLAEINAAGLEHVLCLLSLGEIGCSM